MAPPHVCSSPNSTATWPEAVVVQVAGPWAIALRGVVGEADAEVHAQVVQGRCGFRGDPGGVWRLGGLGRFIGCYFLYLRLLHLFYLYATTFAVYIYTVIYIYTSIYNIIL